MIKKKIIDIALLICILILTACKDNTEHHHNNQGYEVIDTYISDDCNMYVMIFRDGDYILNLNTAGKCGLINSEQYVNSIQDILVEHAEKVPLKKGKILIQFSIDVEISSKDILKLKKALETVFSKNITLVEKTNNTLVFSME